MLYGRAHGPAHTVEHLMVISDFEISSYWMSPVYIFILLLRTCLRMVCNSNTFSGYFSATFSCSLTFPFHITGERSGFRFLFFCFHESGRIIIRFNVFQSLVRTDNVWFMDCSTIQGRSVLSVPIRFPKRS